MQQAEAVVFGLQAEFVEVIALEQAVLLQLLLEETVRQIVVVEVEVELSVVQMVEPEVQV